MFVCGILFSAFLGRQDERTLAIAASAAGCIHHEGALCSEAQLRSVPCSLEWFCETLFCLTTLFFQVAKVS
jgi:hypothetical protein